MSAAAHLPNTVLELLQDLLGAKIQRLERCRPGGNSRVFRAETGTDTFAVKLYAQTGERPNPRFIRETAGLRFLEAAGIDEIVPRVSTTDPLHEIAVLEWIDGTAIASVTDADVGAALAFARRLHAIRSHPEAQRLGAGAEACLSADALAHQIETRLTKLREIDDSRLRSFLTEQLDPLFAVSWARLRSIYAASNWQTHTEIDPDLRTLSPSDFGFHNALRRSSGHLVFLDFEYFGWDDPVKMVADFVLHPGMSLPPRQMHRFAEGAASIFATSCFRRRLDAQLSLYRIRWSLICLNEFLPERWQRRVDAGTGESWDAAKTRQLAKAASLLDIDSAVPLFTADSGNA